MASLSSNHIATSGVNVDSSLATTDPPQWSRRILKAAGIYNLLFGTFVILFPTLVFDWMGMERPRYPQIWQCVGMIVGVYGIGYWIAASQPFRHWPIVLVGFLGKVFGPVGFLMAASAGELPWAWGWMIVANDLIWWAPFVATLWLTFKHHTNTEMDVDTSHSPLATVASHRGATLRVLSMRQPLMVVFLRHLGCTFCREALSELAQIRSELRANGLELALVHPNAPMAATQLFSNYGLEDVHRFSDPQCQLYRQFQLSRGSFQQLFGPPVWIRALCTLLAGHGIGALRADGLRMPGVFVLRKGGIVAEFRHQTAADRPDYRAIMRQVTGHAAPMSCHGPHLAASAGA